MSPDVKFPCRAALPDGRLAYSLVVNDVERLTVYVSATGRSVRVFDTGTNELKMERSCWMKMEGGDECEPE